MNINIKNMGKVVFALLITFLIAGCWGDGDGSATPPPADTTPPSIPVNFIATVVSSTEINLTWDASTDNVAVVGYTIYRDGNPITNVASIYYSDSSLSANTEYCYSVSSYDAAANESDHSIRICVTTDPAPDITPPSVTSTVPADAAINVELDAVITATFSEAMLSSSINNTSFTVVDSDDNPVSGIVTYNDSTNTATFTPAELFTYAETYTAKIFLTVKDLAGNAMVSDVTWSFTSKAQQVTFTISGSYSIEPDVSVTDIATVDFTGNNNLDLALTYYQTDTVSVLLGDGTGAFGARTDFATGDQPASITYGYFNADTNIDMAIANGTYVLPFPLPPGTVSILLGDGTGSFSAATNYDVGNRPLDISAADFNGDNFIDLVTANQFSDDVSVIFGAGDGTFTSATSYTVGWRPSSIAVGDYNTDQILDLATADSSDGTVSILLGTNTGTFGTSTSFASGSYPMSIATDDLDNDTDLDLVVANDGTSNVTVLLGDGTGAFGNGIPVPVGQYPQTVSIAELNNDGIPDLVVTTRFNGGIGTNSVYVLLGYGEGVFGVASTVYSVASQFINPPLVEIGDFNGDGKSDLAVTDPVNDKVYILLNTTI